MSLVWKPSLSMTGGGEAHHDPAPAAPLPRSTLIPMSPNAAAVSIPMFFMMITFLFRSCGNGEAKSTVAEGKSAEKPSFLAQSKDSCPSALVAYSAK